MFDSVNISVLNFMTAQKFFEECQSATINYFGSSYYYGSSGNELNDLIVAIKKVSTRNKQFWQILHCDAADLESDISIFVETHYNHIKNCNTHNINSVADYNNTFLSNCLLVEYCIINLYNSGYFNPTPEKITEAFEQKIQYYTQKDLQQLIDEGGYAGYVKQFLVHITDRINFIIHYDTMTKEIKLSKNAKCSYGAYIGIKDLSPYALHLLKYAMDTYTPN